MNFQDAASREGYDANVAVIARPTQSGFSPKKFTRARGERAEE